MRASEVGIPAHRKNYGISKLWQGCNRCGGTKFILHQILPGFNPGSRPNLTSLIVPTMKNVLFICSQNKLRSPTAEAVFAGWPGVEVDSAGLNNDAVVPLTPEQVEWADLIFVMEKVHREKLNRKFERHLNHQRVIVLRIPDRYHYMDPDLVGLLKAKVTPYF